MTILQQFLQLHITTIAFSLVVLIPLLYMVAFVGRRPKGCPPGPPTLPIIGNIHQLPKKDIHKAYQKWGEQYGPIFSLQLGQQTVIVLTDGYVVKELLDKQSSNTSDRPKLYMQKLYESSRIIMRGYDDLWKLERKLYHMFLNQNVAAKYEPYQSLETKNLCFDLLNKPVDFVNFIGRTTSSLSTSMTYGFRIPNVGNPVADEMYKNAHGFFQLVIKSQFLDWYPSLRPLAKLLPYNPLASKARKLYQKEREHFRKLYMDAQFRAENGNAQPCFAHDIAHAQRTWKDSDLLTDHAASYIAGISFEGGADTTRNTLIGFVKAMVLFPEAQKLAQDELDRIIGSDRMPEMADMPALPIIRGTIKESLRWMPTAVTGAIPHAARTPTQIQTYDIPNGSTISLGVWACNNQPSLFPDPRVFDPTRHNVSLSFSQAAVATDVRDRDNWTFGAGRRLCPGIQVAERTLFLAVARMLWAFEFRPKLDEKGVVVEMEMDAVTQSIAACPLPFECEIVPRDEKRAKIIRDEWKKASELLDHEGNYKEYILKK